jgi:Zn-dependent peptidase ImmA (M78 family)
MHGIDQSLEALRHFARRRGTAVRYADLPDGIGGCVDGEKIVLRAGLSPQQELLTLVHELTHVMAHVASVRARTPRTVCEYEAEAVERLIAQRLGFAAAEFESSVSESPPFPDGLLAESVTRVWGVARTLIAVLSARQSLERFTPASAVTTQDSRASVVRQR